MQKHRSEWDVTTEKGREALERFLMRQMGWEYGLDPHSYSPAWFGEIEGKRWVMPKGWVFGPTAMITLKQWALREKDITILSKYDRDVNGEWGYAEAWWYTGYGEDASVNARADDEPTAVALALARALEEMERTA